MAEGVMIPVPRGPNEVQPRKEFSEWPKWFTSPTGQRRKFNAAHEVPDDWSDQPPESAGVSAPSVPDYGILLPADDADADADDATTADADADERMSAQDLVDSHTQAELVAILAAAKKAGSEVEYLDNWPKLKLATAIVENDLAPAKAEQE